MKNLFGPGIFLGDTLKNARKFYQFTKDQNKNYEASGVLAFLPNRKSGSV